MKNDYNRKDCLPNKKIKMIKNILKKNKIKVKESKVININNSIYSVRIELKDFKGIGTNGKGITKEYALASGYSEFMERLQSKNLIKPDFLNKVSNHKFYKDEYYLDYNEFVKKFKNMEILKEDNVLELLKSNDEYRYYTKFYDVINKEDIDLPIKLINMLSHSNGLCAGNSKEEALVQGICEVFERYVYKELILKELEIPNIQVEKNQIRGVLEQLEQLKKLGYDYKIKDCSLNGLFPVVGLLICDKKKKNYLFSIGSDPNFEIALQRCVTEIFQGLLGKEIKNKLKPINNQYNNKKKTDKEEFLQLNWLKCYTSNNGIHPKNFFCSNKNVTLKQLDFINNSNNIDAYNYIISIVKKNKLKLYIKDYSILGFNTYKVYIPKLSDVDSLDDFKLELYNNIKELKNCYYNFIEMKGKDNSTFESMFEKLSINIRYSELIYPYNLFSVNYFIDNDYIKLNYFYLLIIELIMNKKYVKTIKILEDRLKKYDISEFEKDYLEYLKYKLTKEKNISKKYSKYIINDVELLLNDTEKYLRKLNAMECPNCPKCKNKRKCKYKEWIKINKILEKNSKI